MDINKIVDYCKKKYPQKSINRIANELSIDRNKLSKIMKDTDIEIIRYRRKYALNEAFFEIIDSEEKAYWLGFIAADGCVYRRTLSINLNIKDKAHLEKLIAILNSET